MRLFEVSISLLLVQITTVHHLNDITCTYMLPIVMNGV